MKRREYKIDPILVNNIIYTEVIIDPHYEEKHSDHINDELILKLVEKLNGRFELPVDSEDNFKYYVTILYLDSKSYRLIWLIEDQKIYIGIVNAFRDKKGEK